MKIAAFVKPIACALRASRGRKKPESSIYSLEGLIIDRQAMA